MYTRIGTWVGLKIAKNAFERDVFHVITFLEMLFHLFHATSVILVERSDSKSFTLYF